MNKKGKTDAFKIVAFAAIAYVVYMFATGGLGGTTQPQVPTTPETPTVSTICDSTTTPSLDFLCRDIDNTGTAVTCTAHYKILKNADGTNGDGLIQTDDDATNIALDPGDTIEYYINSTGWYAIHVSNYIVPCKEEPRVNVLMKDYATTPTMQFFCEDDGLLMAIDGSSNTEEVAAADEPTLEFRYYANTEDYIQDALFWCEYDKTYFDDVLINGDKGSGTLIPSHFSFSSGETGMDGTAGGWSLGDIHGTSAVSKSLTIDTDDTNDATGYNISCYLDDQDWFINEDKGIFEYGTSDENDADVGQLYNGVAGFVENISTG